MVLVGTPADELAVSTPRADVRRRVALKNWFAVLVLAGLFVSLRCVHLDSDPPNWIRGCFTRELYAEPPAKAHEARNFALFGQWHLNPADNYQFWRAQSPVWVYPLTAVFGAFGTDYPQLRAYSTAYSALGVVFVLLLCAGRLSRAALTFVGLVLALDWVHFHYTRVGLLEPAVSTWVSLSMLALVRAAKDARYLPLAHLAFALAFFTKQGALYALPVVVLGSAWVLRPAKHAPDNERRARLWGVTSAVALVILSALYVTSDAYRRTIEYNAGHVFLGSDLEARYQWQGLESVIFRVMDKERYWHFWVSVRLTGPIALATLGWWLLRLVRRPQLETFQLVVAAWFVCSLVAMLVVAQSELRFWTLAVPPAAVLAGAGLDEARTLLNARNARRLSGLLLPAAIAWNVALNARGLERALRDPSFRLRDSALQLRAHLGSTDATIVGMASPQLVLGTPYKNYYVRREFNTSRIVLKRLGITHLLAYGTRDHTRVVMSRHFPGLLRRARPELSVAFRGQRYDLYRVDDRLTRYVE